MECFNFLSNEASVNSRLKYSGTVIFLVCIIFGAKSANADLNIHVTSHQVWFIWHHSKIVVTYDQPSECTACSEDQIVPITSATEGCFTTRRTSSGYCTTIGGGAVPFGISARLLGAANRPAGIRDTLTSIPIAIIPRENQTMQEVLLSLLNALNSHREDWNCHEDKRMNYDTFPSNEGGGYNSNSFISGITHFVGLAAPDLKPNVNVPGYGKKVLEERFNYVECLGE